jgi:hypothetical protein
VSYILSVIYAECRHAVSFMLSVVALSVIYAECHLCRVSSCCVIYAECRHAVSFMLSVVVLSVVMLNVMAPF